MNKLFLKHFSFLQDFTIKIAVTLEQLQLLGQTNTQPDIVATKLKWLRGQLIENYCVLSKFTLALVRSEVSTAPRLHCSTGSKQGRDDSGTC